MIMTVIIDERTMRPVLAVTHNSLEAAQQMAKRLNQANAELDYTYKAIVEVIH